MNPWSDEDTGREKEKRREKKEKRQNKLDSNL